VGDGRHKRLVGFIHEPPLVGIVGGRLNLLRIALLHIGNLIQGFRCGIELVIGDALRMIRNALRGVSRRWGRRLSLRIGCRNGGGEDYSSQTLCPWSHRSFSDLSGSLYSPGRARCNFDTRHLRQVKSRISVPAEAIDLTCQTTSDFDLPSHMSETSHGTLFWNSGLELALELLWNSTPVDSFESFVPTFCNMSVQILP